MNFTKKTTGELGEELAVKFLKKNRYKILEQNKENHLGEIDILARTPGILKNDIVIVEVKTKSTDSFGEGYEMVNYFKRKKLLSLARELQKEYPAKTIRIDIISVDLSEEKPEIKHFVNAVEEE